MVEVKSFHLILKVKCRVIFSDFKKHLELDPEGLMAYGDYLCIISDMI